MGFSIPECSAITKVIESILKCYVVKAKYSSAKKIKGIRAAVYKCAAELGACYLPQSAKSISYIDNSDDLQITLVFKNRDKAEDFQTFLSHWSMNDPLVVKPDAVSVERVMQKLYLCTEELCSVSLSHYDGSESEPLILTLEDIRAPGSASSSDSAVSVVRLNSDLAQFQSIERLVPFLQPYRVHIKPKRFKALENNDNNIIAGSWHPFRQLFLGKHIDAYGYLDIPLIALKPLTNRAFQEEMVGSPPHIRTRVEIQLECYTEEVATEMGRVLKPGSTRESSTEWKTFVLVCDAQTFCECLEWRYKKTHKIWDEIDQD